MIRRARFPDTVILNGHKTPLIVKRHGRAKRPSLRFDSLRDRVVLVMPRNGLVRHGVAFLEKTHDWLEERHRQEGDRTVFEDGVSLPILGMSLIVTHVPEARQGCWIDGNRLYVSGEKEFLPRRLRDFLKKQVRIRLREEADYYAEELNLPAPPISVRETSSRWGSCSASGRLSFSWRIVFAPSYVRQYLVAHEAAHLREMNHSAAFWKTVSGLCPDYEKAQTWLKKEGRSLHRYG